MVSWLNEFGFSYYISTDDEEDLKKYVKKKFNIGDNEDTVLAESLIINSIYNYILYTIFKNRKKQTINLKNYLIIIIRKNRSIW